LLTVKKTGNVAMETEVLLNVMPSLDGWNVNLNVSSVRLRRTEEVLVSLGVRAPRAALLHERQSVRVEARDSAGDLLAACTVNTTVLAVHGILIRAGSYALSTIPGQRVSTPVSILNEGNGPEILISGESILPYGWNTRLEYANESVALPGKPLTLGAGSNITLTLVIFTSAGTLAGSYYVAVPLLDGEGKELLVTVQVEVLQVFELALEAEGAEQTVAPGGQAIFGLVARNRGNGPDRMDFSLSGLPEGWEAPVVRFENAGTITSLSLGPFGYGRIQVVVTVPARYTGDAVDLLVNASSPHGFSGSVRLDMWILHVNLAISNVTFSPESPRPGQVVRLKLLVSNTGGVDLENVVIGFRDGDGEPRLRDLGRLASGMSWEYEHEWVAREGKHTLSFMVDPGNDTAEDDERDNAVEVTVRVEAEKAAGMPQWQGAVAAVAVLVVLVLVAWTVLGRRR